MLIVMFYMTMLIIDHSHTSIVFGPLISITGVDEDLLGLKFGFVLYPSIIFVFFETINSQSIKKLYYILYENLCGLIYCGPITRNWT